MSGPPGPSGAPGAPRRRGPRPRHTRQEVARAAVALYSYVPDKQTLVYDMVEEVSGELSLSEPGCPSRGCPSPAVTGGPTCTYWLGRSGRCCTAIRG